MSDKEVKDGLYLFYVKDKQIYPIAQSDENWEILEGLRNVIIGKTVQMIDRPMGYVRD